MCRISAINGMNLILKLVWLFLIVVGNTPLKLEKPKTVVKCSRNTFWREILGNTNHARVRLLRCLSWLGREASRPAEPSLPMVELLGNSTMDTQVVPNPPLIEANRFIDSYKCDVDCMLIVHHIESCYTYISDGMGMLYFGILH